MSSSAIIKWWQDKKLITKDDFKLALDNFSVIFACNSNAIEGNTASYHTTRAVFDGEVLSNFNGTARELFEVQNQKFAFEFIVRALERKEPISVPFIKKLHKILLYGCYDDVRWNKGERPGQFKINDFCVGVSDVGSFPEDVSDDIESLVNEIQENSNGDVFIVAAYLHAKFETIHPFADGNGRVGRTLMNYYLMLHNHPPIIIHSEDKETYYMALEVYDKSEELSGFIQFLKEQLVKTWQTRVHGVQRPTLEQITKARELAPDAYKSYPDDMLWNMLGKSITNLND